MNEVVADVIELMQSRAKDMEVELSVELQKSMPVLTFDPDGLHRAVLNVVTNAIDACDREGDPGLVRVRTAYDHEAQVVRVIIEDNGTGIAAEDVEKVFTLFVSRKGGRGTGLGLPVSAKIVKEHGGRIDVDSEVGRGSRFTLELPAVPVDAPVAGESFGTVGGETLGGGSAKP
jgi:signal transduction histidine kinase